MFETRLASDEVIPNDIIMNFTDILHTSFTNRTILQEICENYNNLSGKELWRKLDCSGKLSSTINYNTLEEEATLEFLKDYPENEPSLDNFKVYGSIYIPVMDYPISINKIKESFNEHTKEYHFTKNTLNPIKDVLFGLVHLLFNVIFLAIDAVKWSPSMLFTIPMKGNLIFPKNWRGIQLSEYYNAWYDRVLSNRIKLWMSIDEFQTAYQSGKSCNIQIFTLRAITELE